MSAFFGALGAIPALVSLLKQVWDYINKISGNDPAAWAADVGTVFSQLNAAQSQEEHAAAAKALADLLGHHLK